ncbi:MAG: hypothetical protein COA43_01230 [Robiginitomaculum sp.]|nr:MAG: hypothetical protein COA43_01230 [Robiginitomaculum sp.]
MSADIIEHCDGYKTLEAAIARDGEKYGDPERYNPKLGWAVARAKHYAEKTGLRATDILNSWESKRNYWYMNYYQDCQQPEIKGDDVRVFDTPDALHDSIGKTGFRCPMCESISKSPYVCDSGKEMEKGKVCDWKSYGLFGTMGKGVYVFVKSALRGESIFKPISWEKS